MRSRRPHATRCRRYIAAVAVAAVNTAADLVKWNILAQAWNFAVIIGIIGLDRVVGNQRRVTGVELVPQVVNAILPGHVITGCGRAATVIARILARHAVALETDFVFVFCFRFERTADVDASHTQKTAADEWRCCMVPIHRTARIE